MNVNTVILKIKANMRADSTCAEKRFSDTLITEEGFYVYISRKTQSSKSSDFKLKNVSILWSKYWVESIAS